MMTLTGKEIKDLAEAVGLVVCTMDYTDELETEMTIIEFPIPHFFHIIPFRCPRPTAKSGHPNFWKPYQGPSAAVRQSRQKTCASP